MPILDLAWPANTRAAFWGWESLFVYAIRKHRSQRRTLPELLVTSELEHLTVVRLRSPGEVERWLGTIPAAPRSEEM